MYMHQYMKFGISIIGESIVTGNLGLGVSMADIISLETNKLWI